MRNVNRKSRYQGKALKGDTMYEMIEFEDEKFNHYLHHFDECDTEHPGFNLELDCIVVTADLAEEIIWR